MCDLSLLIEVVEDGGVLQQNVVSDGPGEDVQWPAQEFGPAEERQSLENAAPDGHSEVGVGEEVGEEQAHNPQALRHEVVVGEEEESDYADEELDDSEGSECSDEEYVEAREAILKHKQLCRGVVLVDMDAQLNGPAEANEAAQFPEAEVGPRPINEVGHVMYGFEGTCRKNSDEASIYYDYDEASWNWFINLLRRDVGLGDGQGWVIISDQQKGLVHAVQDYLLAAEQRMCVRHLYANWRKQFKEKELRRQYWSACKSSSDCEMWTYLSRMAELSPAGFVKMKENLQPKFWCRAFFSDASKCDSVDNNMCETFNGKIVAARSLPIISMLEEIRLYVMKRMVQKRDAVHKWQHPFAPRIAKELVGIKKKSQEWSLTFNGIDGYEVTRKDHKFVVYLGKQTCTCRRWQLKGYPCVHGYAAITNERGQVHDYISDWYKVPKYLKAYSVMMEPVRGIGDWPMTIEPTLLPPLDRRMPGRPKLNKRRLEEGERAQQQGGANHITRLGKRMFCSNCHKPDHNKRTCPDKVAENHEQQQCSQQAGPSQPPPTQPEYIPPTRQQEVRQVQGRGRSGAIAPQARPPVGFGVYTNPDTGEQATNPGTMPTRGRGGGSGRGRGKSRAKERG